ncbi:hypothetical protein Taro_049944 [Colocasia esculenta]|uniref:Uncharacterized protein n=1 Tax=Colocasia esculenta TaxID=4460 RepID=A0A843XC65_COLES|nr:hypothetical protein [Colocasia esculenta]
MLCHLLQSAVGDRGVLYDGGLGQMVKQLGGTAFVTMWNLVATTVINLVSICNHLEPRRHHLVSICNRVEPRFTSLRMPEDQLIIGDDAVYGEEA